MNKDRSIAFLRKIPTHTILILICVMWLVPAIGLLVTFSAPSRT